MEHNVFPRTELDNRLSRVRHAMRNAGIDALIVSVPEMNPDWLTTLLEERGVDNIGEAAKKD